MKIQVFNSPVSDAVMAEFDSVEDFELWLEDHPEIEADQVALNGRIILGWDEYEEWKEML